MSDGHNEFLSNQLIIAQSESAHLREEISALKQRIKELEDATNDPAVNNCAAKRCVCKKSDKNLL
jgi:BMFP domain-containing protein YqiC